MVPVEALYSLIWCTNSISWPCPSEAAWVSTLCLAMDHLMSASHDVQAFPVFIDFISVIAIKVNAGISAKKFTFNTLTSRLMLLRVQI